MFKLGLEKAEEPEIKLPTSVGSSEKSKSVPEKTLTSALLTTPKPLTVWILTNWKILKEITDHLTCLLRNLYAGQETTVRIGHGTMDWFQIGKGVCQGCILSPCLFKLYAEYIMRNAGLEEAQAGIKIAGRNIKELKSLLMIVKEESEKVGLKLYIQKTKITASDPITSLQINEETMETMTDFLFLSFKITVDGDHSHEIKRCLLLRRKAMTNLDSILKSRDITLLTRSV